MTVRLEVVAPGAWPARVADELVQRLAARPELRVCLPTGATPGPLYDELVARDAPFDRAEIVLLDDYLGLPGGDPARGGDRLRRELVSRLRRPPAAYHQIDLDAEAAAAADRHDRVAARGLDLALVGIGLNGHVGFNEPGSGPDSPTRVVELHDASREVAAEAYGAAGRPRLGITIGLARLLEAEELWLLATGARKAEVLRRALREPETEECPASFLRRHPRLTVFADEPAAALAQASAVASSTGTPSIRQRAIDSRLKS